MTSRRNTVRDYFKDGAFVLYQSHVSSWLVLRFAALSACLLEGCEDYGYTATAQIRIPSSFLGPLDFSFSSFQTNVFIGLFLRGFCIPI